MTDMENKPQIITNIKIERSIFWKIYFFFIVCVTVLGTVFLFSEENFGVFEIILIPIVIISMIGLFGYVFSKIIYKRSFWFYIFWLNLVFAFLEPFLSESLFAHDPDFTDAENKIINIISYLVSILIMLPAYIGLLLYGLPSNRLWKIKE